MTSVPFLELHSIHSEIREELDQAYARVMDSGHFILGRELEAFEAEFAEYSGVSCCVGVGNGLDAIHLSLVALGIGEGDEVIVPSNTFIATLLGVSATGAVPVPVEPDTRTFNLDTGKTAAAITPKTRAIMPVHLYGQPADMDPLCSLAQERGLSIICDAAQSQGAMYRSSKIATFGDVTATSFYPGKNLGALGDGGAVLTDNEELADRVRMLRNYGSEEKYHHELMGVNSRLDEMQAAFLRVKLRKLDDWITGRRRVAAFYTENIDNPSIDLPVVPDWAEPVWHLYVVRSLSRAALIEHLQDASIATGIHYPVALHRQGCYTELRGLDLPIAEMLADEVLSLPMSPGLSDEQLQQVVDAVNSFPG